MACNAGGDGEPGQKFEDGMRRRIQDSEFRIQESEFRSQKIEKAEKIKRAKRISVACDQRSTINDLRR